MAEQSQTQKSPQPRPPARPSPADVNRGNQMNTDHEAYWKSRGTPMPADPKDRRK